MPHPDSVILDVEPPPVAPDLADGEFRFYKRKPRGKTVKPTPARIRKGSCPWAVRLHDPTDRILAVLDTYGRTRWWLLEKLAGVNYGDVRAAIKSGAIIDTGFREKNGEVVHALDLPPSK